MNTSTILKLSLLVGAALLVGLHLPSPWRATPGQPWEVDSTLAAGGGSHDGRHHDLQKSKGKRVEVDVYGESLCPDTTHAIVDVIGPLFTNGIASIMKLHYYAYGKVRETESGLQCQHGPLECKMNRYLNCAQELHPGNQSDWYRYAACVHRAGRQIEERASGGCAEERGWDTKELNDCALGELGDKLERKAQKETKELGKLSFVPWILVNDVAIGYDFEPLAKYICTAYSGPSRHVSWDHRELLARSV
ncbi:hypothetical protein N2152v2_011228 [Parachlorella kessleri]